MKHKSGRHKEENTFKFIPFSERINNVEINVFRHIGHENETGDQDIECYFYQAIQKWDVLNLTESYRQFKKEIKANSIVTLPQLVHNKDNIVQLLIKYLKQKNILFLQPLLEFVVALAQDLRSDFYEYYQEFLDVIISLLHAKEVEQLEWTFTCLAQLFKILWRILIKNINIIFNTLLPLLSNERPEYINNFAAESFAFVARKVKDKKTFLLLITKSLKRNKDSISGCGRLLYEVVANVQSSFHSCAEQWLKSYIEILQEKGVSNIWCEVLEEVVQNIVTYIYPHNGQLFWTVFIYSTQQFLKENNEKSAEVANFLLKCIGQGVEYKGGVFLKNVSPLNQILLMIVNNKDSDKDLLMTCTKVIILLLLSRNIKLQQEEVSCVIRAVLNLKHKDIFLYFIENIFDCALFEALILPTFLKFCVTYNLDCDTLKVLTKLIIKKSPLRINGCALNSWMKYELRFGSKQEEAKIEEKFLEYIDLNKNGNEEIYTYSMVCLPHTNVTHNMQILMDNMDYLSEKLMKKCNVEKNLFLFAVTFESMLHISNDEIKSLFDIFVNIILPLCNKVEYIAALQVLDLFLTSLNEHMLTKELLKQIHSQLELNLCSPYHEIRLYTTHIYSLFDKCFKFENTEDWNVFTLCYKVESTETLVNTYREQMMHLEKLNFDKPQMMTCKETEYVTVPLRYLCGVLYINFKLLWEPVTKIIASYSVGMDIGVFWLVFSEELKSAVNNVKNHPIIVRETVEFSDPLLYELYQNILEVDNRADFSNYRLLLWKTMELFPEIAEAKTRDISTLLLNFIEEEYMKSNTDTATTWNIKQNQPIEDNENEDVEENDDKIKKELKISPPSPKGKSNLRTLLQHLTVFSKVRSPKSMYREPELYRLYFDLLSHKKPEVQKAALDCIMTYKFKYLTPYSEHLYKLIDEKNFKDELVKFRIDQDSNTVQKEHRKDLIPVVMKLVFSKMIVKTGLRTGGKSGGGQLRRNLIFRFLAGCDSEEMTTFIKMTFKFYDIVLSDDLSIMAKKCSNINLEKFVPPKRLQSSLNMINVILAQFGGLMDTNLLSYILKILLYIGCLLKIAQENYSQIHAGYFGILRNLRTSSLKLLHQFFELFNMYPWSAEEINTVFDVFIWPYLNKLNIEGIHSPTNLLKLLACWGSNPRYFNLLVKFNQTNPEEYALPCITQLLVNNKTHPSVSNLIMEMVEKLLTLQPNEDDIKNKIPVEDEVPIQEELIEQLKVDEKLNYGSCILLPHVSIILQKIKQKLENKSKNINQKHLFILTRLSELVTQSDICDNLLELLLPIAMKKSSSNASEEVLLQMVTTLRNMMLKVDHPEKHLKQLSPLFSEISDPSSRKLLCSILGTISKSSEKYVLMNNLLYSLNAWDQKWVDQPDFKTRSEAFKQLLQLINEKQIDTELGVLLIYNNFYYLKNVADISLKEHATHSLKMLCPYLVNYTKNYAARVYVLDETLFNLIRLGFKSKNDDFRNECICLLGYLARESPETHVILRDLSKLTNKQDIEVDFFENITHLQVHRHGRALLKFCSVYKESETSPNIRTMTQFILPLTTFYLCNEKYASKNSVIDAAIETVEIISRLLPWQQYEALLKFYLGKLKKSLQFQKQVVRIIVTILDAFHFDLSKGHNIQSIKDGLKKQDQPDEMEVEESEKKKIDAEIDDPFNKPEDTKQQEDGGDDEEIDVILNDIKNEDDTEEQQENVVKKAYEKITVLCPSAALRIINTIQNILLPQLHRCLAEMTHHESSHKVNRKKTSIEREEEDLLRVPISLALVKLLQKLPKEILDANITGILMKLCTFLKSQLESVRRVARESLQKIMITLGPSYLKLLFDEMVPLLSRGFQVHVLVYTVHAVLNFMKDVFTPGDIDKILATVVKLCNTDLFGVLSEERDVMKIVSKVSEAKSSKSMDTFKIIAQFITEDYLKELVNPIKEILTNTHSYKILNKVQEAFKHIALGLIDNKYIKIEVMLQFSYTFVSESMSDIKKSEQQTVLSEKEIDMLRRQKPDCYIIAKEPVYRSGYRTSTLKTSSTTNIHIITEFGLKICYFLLKRDILKGTSHDLEILNNFVPIMKECLESKNIKLCTVTLQCLPWIFKYDLPSLHQHIENITEIIFSILHKYAAAGLSKGDNFDLVVASFKAITVLVRDVKFYIIKQDQLKILLLYIEQDLHDYDRQATAYGLLKALLSRKLSSPEIYDIMKKVLELSVTSELPHIRSQSRGVAQQFILEYPIGKKLDTYISFYLSQLKFELQTGRESAIEMIQNLITSLPMEVLKQNSGTFFVTLGARLVNDSQPTCRKMIGESLQTMLERLSKGERDPLFDILLLWLNDNIISHRRLAAQLCGIFVVIEKSQFESRLNNLLPLVIQQFRNSTNSNAGRYVKINRETQDEESVEEERVRDHLLFQLLQTLLKICNNCPAFLKRVEDVESISNSVQTLLAHPHDWVRLAATQLLGFVLTAIDVDHLATLMIENRIENGYLYSDPINGLKSLSLDLCDQLQPNLIKSDLAEQVVKNLVFVARVLEKVSGKEVGVNLIWLIKRMRKLVNREIIETPASSTIRMEIFKFVAGITVALNKEIISENAYHLMAILVREMVGTEQKDAPLRHLSKEVATIIKKKIGVEKYTEILTSVEKQLSVRRAERKRARNQLAITDPELHARKKIKHHEKKKLTKKRKIDERKGVKRKFRKKDTIDLDSSEIM